MDFVPNTLLEVLEARAQTTDKGFTFLDYQLQPEFWSFARMVSEARRRATVFTTLGLQPGDRVALMLPDVREFVLSFFAAVAAGVVPVPMYPLFGPRATKEFVLTAANILQQTGSRVLIADLLPEELAHSATQAGVQRIVTAAELTAASIDMGYVRPDRTAEDTCFLQFTSGSTRAPKGVVVSHANLLANCRAIMLDGIKGDPETDLGVCWLPLYHDMGLIGHVLATLVVGMSVVFLPTLAFIARPSVWLATVHKYRGTITFGPNFAMALAAKRLNRNEALDLSCLRVVGCGAEPIHAATLRTFIDTFAPYGLRPEVITPCYGLAEATLAVTFDSLERPVRVIHIDRAEYETRGVARVVIAPDPTCVELTSCGTVLPRHEVTIRDDAGHVLPDGHVGEIALRGPSITPGYFRDDDASGAARLGDWLLTGDRGFLREGELFVCGRKKDLLIIDGRNYYPQSLEWVVEELPGVRRGAVVAFSIPGADTEALVVVAETRNKAERPELTRQIRQSLRASVGLVPADVVLVGPGQLPKTSSGKLQRQKTKQMYSNGSFSIQATP